MTPAARRLWRLARLANRAARVFRIPRIRALRRMVELHRRDGFDLDEIAGLGLLDPSLPADELRQCVPGHRYRVPQRRLSPEPLTAVIDDKALFATMCALAELPTPRVRCLLYAGFPGWTFDGTVPTTRAEWADALDRVLPPDFVSKPARGDFGDGVRAFERRGGRIFEGGREVGDTAALYDAVLADRRYDGFVVQDRAWNHDVISALSGSRTLQTARIATLLERPGKVSILYAELKVVTGESVVDNFRGGSNGNGISLIDLESGRLGPLVLSRHDMLGLVRADRHPKTGCLCSGVQLPFWPETLELVERAASALPMLGSVGWDVAITPEGPQLIEGNTGWGGPNELGLGRRLLLHLEDAAATAGRPVGARAGVRLSPE